MCGVWYAVCFTILLLLEYCRDQIDSSGGSHLEAVTEDMETMDDNEGEQQGLASSSSSEGDLELPTASAPPSSQSPSRSRSSQPPKPAPPRQRPSIPPRPKESATAAATSSSSEGQLEPTPFDLPDPFQDFEKTEEKESIGPAAADQRKKEQMPTPAPKPTRPPVMKKPQPSIDTSTKVGQ